MNRIGLWGVLGTLALALIGGVFGFYVLPRAQDSRLSPWAAWCSALGITTRSAATEIPLANSNASAVTLTHELLGPPRPDDIGRGATLALQCSMCHGPTGISVANTPNLAGQYSTVIYKELRDFKSRARSNAIMNPMADTLTDEAMRQIAYYYASLPRPRESQPLADAPGIVKWGAPSRNIAPCGSCHGDIDHILAGPWLGGEPGAYIRAQLVAFANGERSNDINGQMRAMARGLTAVEIEQTAFYYAGNAK